MGHSERHIPYKPPVGMMVLCTLFFVACMAVFLFHLPGGDGLNSSRKLEGFSVETQRVILWTLAACCAVFVALGLAGMVRGLTSKGEVVLTENTISAPRSSLSGKIVTLAYDDLTGVNVISVGRQRFLVLRHAGGKLSIASQSLPKGMSVEELFLEVEERRKARDGQG